MFYYLERCREEQLNYLESRDSKNQRAKSLLDSRCAARCWTKYRWWLFSPRTPAYATGLAARTSSSKRSVEGHNPRKGFSLQSLGWRCNWTARPIVSLVFAERAEKASLFNAWSARKLSRITSFAWESLTASATVVLHPSTEQVNRRPGWITRRIVFNPAVSRTSFRIYIDSKAGRYLS